MEGLAPVERTVANLLLQIRWLISSGLACSVALNPVLGRADASQSSASLGDRLQIRLSSGDKLRGVLTGISEEGLTLAAGKKALRAGREDVSKIHLLVRKSPAKQIAIGAGIGLGAFIAGHAIAFPSERAPTHPSDPALMGLLAGLGAVVGWVVGRRPKKVLIYDADGPGAAWPKITEDTNTF